MLENLKLQTKVNIAPGNFPDFEANAVFCGIGSCFSENLINMLVDTGFDAVQNPTGIVYNACSIMQVIERCAHDRPFERKDFFAYGGLYHSWEHHGNFSKDNLEAAVNTANHALGCFREKLLHADALIITPSSSVVYVNKETETIVANCHKLPNNCFYRRIVSVDENYRYLSHLVNLVAGINAECKIIFTLSPVRHYPGDLVLNGQSKANLLAAVHQVCNDGSCCYFPAYEILNDELRDYRFYKPDMLHPSDLTVDYICTSFLKTILSRDAFKQYKNLLKAAEFKKHRRINS
ncbi:GSCFA domain-containing protein [Lentisphaerota bacterium ZTH]|nr:GSCFA domain-containing protein [Lentisphaerota bacterium]WET07686.1 GSCFA domain-containing protein [Lentisphaerota bacterium ZTH]